MYDQVIISADMLTVIENNNIQKFKEYFIWILIPLCTLFSITIFKHIDSPLKYLLILFFLLLIGYYKFVCLRISTQNKKNSNKKLSVSRAKIEYFDGMHTYLIPIAGIVSIEDRSIYYDFQGPHERGWDHIFAIKLRENCRIVRISVSKEIYLTGQDIPEIQIFNLVLKHSDYENVLNYIFQMHQATIASENAF